MELPIFFLVLKRVESVETDFWKNLTHSPKELVQKLLPIYFSMQLTAPKFVNGQFRSVG